MEFLEFLKNNIVVLDGGMGTLLQAKGLKAGEHPESWNISHPDVIKDVHKAYFDAGSNVVNTNTFGANCLKFGEEELEKIVCAAVENAKNARAESTSTKEKFIALDLGPTGKLLKPLGELDFEDAVEVFKKTVRLGVKHGVDLIFIETMNDSYETKAALLAVKEETDKPVLVSNAFSQNGKLMTGATPEAMVALLEGMGADAIGVNCSLGPEQLGDVAKRYVKNASVPVVLKPNAGLPREENGKTVFDITPEEFAQEVALLIKQGVRVAGGCCGTTPQYIKLLCDEIEGLKPVKTEEKSLTQISSYNTHVEFSQKCLLIGERINPTGKKRFKQALVENDMEYILNVGLEQAEKGVDILDVNVGLPDIDEPEFLKRTVTELQAVTGLPLQIDTSDYAAMEGALRIYNGKALVNSVSGKQESMDKVFPLVKKYGGVVIALTLDENGIPNTAEERLEIAKKIVKEAEKYGIGKKDIVFDTLTMTISTDPDAAHTTIKALKLIKEQLGCHTSLGVSNVSFGLPERDAVNSTFFLMAMQAGLSAAIMNPFSAEMLRAYYAYNALNGADENFADYMSKVPSVTFDEKKTAKEENKQDSVLKESIIKGLREQAAKVTKEMLAAKGPMSIVEEEIIPALDTVGAGYEKGTLYLPQLLLSAEASKAAFEVIKENTPASNEKTGMTVVIATVEGDIHDIGKNIVRLLLENYGFDVCDLGKNVKASAVLDAVVEKKAELCALSALMTTTVPAMEETVKLIHEKAPWCKIMVGGAVLNSEYAQKIGADKYGADALEAVRYAEEIKNGKC